MMHAPVQPTANLSFRDSPSEDPPARRGWTNREEGVIRAMYPCAERAEICQALPNHTWGSIRIRASRMSPPIRREAMRPEPVLHAVVASLVARRRAIRVSQAMVADRLGLTRSYINDIECGRCMPSFALADTWATLLELKLVLVTTRRVGRLPRKAKLSAPRESSTGLSP
jgi:DNA-binding XRE family transcriptional regulator